MRIKTASREKKTMGKSFQKLEQTVDGGKTCKRRELMRELAVEVMRDGGAA
jgi:hypothetical protein